MKIDRTMVEVVTVQRGYTLTLSEEDARLVLASLGKARSDDVKSFVDGYFKDEEHINNVEDKTYKLYIKLYDELLPSGGYR